MYKIADGSFAALLIIHFLAAVKPATSLQARHNDRKLSINPSSGGSPVAAVAYKQGFLQLRPIYPILLLTLVCCPAPGSLVLPVTAPPAGGGHT